MIIISLLQFNSWEFSTFWQVYSKKWNGFTFVKKTQNIAVFQPDNWLQLDRNIYFLTISIIYMFTLYHSNAELRTGWVIQKFKFKFKFLKSLLLWYKGIPLWTEFGIRVFLLHFPFLKSFFYYSIMNENKWLWGKHTNVTT